MIQQLLVEEEICKTFYTIIFDQIWYNFCTSLLTLLPYLLFLNTENGKAASSCLHSQNHFIFFFYFHTINNSSDWQTKFSFAESYKTSIVIEILQVHSDYTNMYCCSKIEYVCSFLCYFIQLLRTKILYQNSPHITFYGFINDI